MIAVPKYTKCEGPHLKKTSAASASVIVQRKLHMGSENDPLEKEADHMADRVMSMPEKGLIQRQCETCDQEEDNGLQRKTASHQTSPFILTNNSGNQIANNSVTSRIQSSQGSGQPLSRETQHFMGTRFATDFSGVRIHKGAEASRLSRDLNAKAFTVGRDVYFNSGQYSPETNKGKHLLAHELTHILQQKKKQQISRKLSVENPNGLVPGSRTRRNWQDVRTYMSHLSSAFRVDRTGRVGPQNARFCRTRTRITDMCLCDLHRSGNSWKIKIDDISWPHTERANHRVTVHSTRSVVRFGSWGGGPQAGRRISQSNARVLGHELCGHAWLMERKIHPPSSLSSRRGRLMGRPSHDATIVFENLVAQEMMGRSAPQRGYFADPHHGESFAQISLTGFPSGSSRVSALPASMRARLTQIGRFMTSEPLLRADVLGHADRTGSAGRNRRLSRQRARAVRNYLISRRRIRRSRFLYTSGRINTQCPALPLTNPNCRKVDVFLYIFQGSSLRFP